MTCDCFWRPGSDGCERCNPEYVAQLGDPWDLPEGQTQHCEMCEQEAERGFVPGSHAGHRCAAYEEKE